jgi:hypothetical protein
VKKILGKSALFLYLGSIIAVSVLFGLGVNWICQDWRLDLTLFSHGRRTSSGEVLAAVTLWFLLIWRAVPKSWNFRRQKT